MLAYSSRTVLDSDNREPMRTISREEPKRRKTVEYEICITGAIPQELGFRKIVAKSDKAAIKRGKEDAKNCHPNSFLVQVKRLKTSDTVEKIVFSV